MREEWVNLALTRFEFYTQHGNDKYSVDEVPYECQEYDEIISGTNGVSFWSLFCGSPVVCLH